MEEPSVSITVALTTADAERVAPGFGSRTVTCGLPDPVEPPVVEAPLDAPVLEADPDELEPVEVPVTDEGDPVEPVEDEAALAEFDVERDPEPAALELELASVEPLELEVVAGQFP
jgi:hypothetical protein